MSIEDTLALVGAVAVSFGGGAAIVIALSGYLADLWAKRTLQREHSQLEGQLEELKHELGLTRSSYEHYLDLVLDYYKVFYRHYRMCQRTASADAHRQLPDGSITHTKEEFLDRLDLFLSEWAEQEGKIRLLLPGRILELHEESISRFNEFKRAVQAFQGDDRTRKSKQEAFVKVEEVKGRIEHALREFLRTESLLK